MLSLIDRAINAFNAKTDKGAVSDMLPFPAVYGLLCAFEHGSTDGIRAEDRSRVLKLYGSSKMELQHEIDLASDKLIELELVLAKTVAAGGRNRQTMMSGYLELTETGRRWAGRLNNLSGEPLPERPYLVDCTGCGTLHRNDVACPW